MEVERFFAQTFASEIDVFFHIFSVRKERDNQVRSKWLRLFIMC